MLSNNIYQETKIPTQLGAGLAKLQKQLPGDVWLWCLVLLTDPDTCWHLG